jgi:hypothetical protein
MKTSTLIFSSAILIFTLISCNHEGKKSETKIIFLHHSTGLKIWGAENSLLEKLAWRVNRVYDYVGRKAELPEMFQRYNKDNGTNYQISKKPFPKSKPYGWHNFPFDYYNIWVKNAGEKPFKDEPTLEILTKDYQVIIFKHCFPVCNINEDEDSADINSYYKSIVNYKLQYNALREKMHEFPDTKFILFTGAAQVKSNITEDEAIRAQSFFKWVREEWDIPNDNIYLWDLYSLQTEESVYFKDEYAVSPTDSHPNKVFASKSAKLLFNRIIDVIENDGKGTTIVGEKILLSGQ